MLMDISSMKWFPVMKRSFQYGNAVYNIEMQFPLRKCNFHYSYGCKPGSKPDKGL